MITAEKGIIHRYLKEYKINYKSTHLLARPETEICKLKSHTAESSKIIAVKQDENIVVIIFNLDGSIEFVRVVPAIAG